jgi:hypothetical protein
MHRPDSPYSDSGANDMAAKLEINTPKILLAGLISVILLILIVLGVNAWYLRIENAEIERKWAMSPNTTLAEWRAQEQGRISKAGLSPTSRPTIPIQQAAALLIQLNGRMPSTQPAEPKPEENKPDEKKADEPKSEGKKPDAESRTPDAESKSSELES